MFTFHNLNRLNDKKNNLYWYLSLANIFLSLSLIRTLTLPYIIIPEILFRRILNASIYIAGYFLSMGLFKKYNYKINYILAQFSILAVLISLLIPNHYYIISEHIILPIVILIQILAWIYTSAKNKKESNFAQIFFWASIFAFLTVIIAAISIVYPPIMDLKLTYISFFVFSLSIILYLISELVELKGEVSLQKKTADKMYERAIRDSMTGIYNHGFIASTLEKTTKPYALIIMDIDDFKEINDQYGHQAGDHVIKYVANTIENIVRTTDIVGRYGGDEFIIVIYNCSQDGAEKIAAKIKSAIESPHKTSFGTIKITISMGIYITGAPESGNSSLLKADKALYYVKDHGKAQIKVYNKKTTK